MTAKEKVLSVYSNAVYQMWESEVNTGYTIHDEFGNFLSSEDRNFCNEDDAWQSALNELIKQGLCTE